jgi:hypothetical protein
LGTKPQAADTAANQKLPVGRLGARHVTLTADATGSRD